MLCILEPTNLGLTIFSLGYEVLAVTMAPARKAGLTWHFKGREVRIR